MSFFLQYPWLIPALPLFGFALITFTPLRQSKSASTWTATGLMLVATLLALGLLAAVAGSPTHAESAGAAVGEPAGDSAGAAAGTGHGESAGTAAGTGHGAVAGDTTSEPTHKSFAFPAPAVVQRFEWAPAGSSTFAMGVYIDSPVAVMLAMVTIAATCIHLFSIGYMASNPRQSRFFSFISLFTSAMLLMTMADNLLLFFMAWEIMGLCSYLLIGFLYERPQAYRAAVKAFITTRIGDVLMLLGLVYLWTQAGSLALGTGEGEIFNPEFLKRIGETTNALGMSHASGIALLIFCGTIGKSAQFPLHVWLPDAMEGPTPVSALIHAATMVAAGVFLVARTYPIFQADDGTTLQVVAFIGAFTALFAASIAVAQYDIKRILAYSTLSQLGFMVAALGIGGWVAGMFHLLTHAFFKALLFLGSGAIIHAMEGTTAIEKLHHSDEYAAQQTAQDIRNMGGLRTKLPWTFWTYSIGYLALAGIVPFAGFWSKDEILAHAAEDGNFVVYGVLTLAAFLTAFYMTRQWLLVFFGTFRGEKPVAFVNTELHVGHDDHLGHDDHAGHASHTDAHADHSPWHESPTMTAALVVLASFALTAGFFNLPFDIPGGFWLTHLWSQEPAEINWLVASVSLVVALSGIGIGWLAYRNAFGAAQDTDPLNARVPGMFRLLNEKYRVDELYAASFGRVTNALALAWAFIDRALLNGIVDGVGKLTLFVSQVNFIIDDTLLNDGPDALASGTNAAGRQTRRLQTGKAQDYIAYVFAGTLALAMLYLYVIKK